MSSERNFTIAHLLMALIFLAGIVVRVFELGAVPLSDFEAGAALEALGFITRSGETGVHAAYAALTGLVFFLFDDTDFFARLVPVLASSTLVLLPFIFREKLGNIAALIYSAGLAFDPLFVGVSRLAGGPSLAIGLLLIAAALRIAPEGGRGAGKASVPVAILFALALLSGPSVFFGILSLGFTYAAVRAFGGPDEEVIYHEGIEDQSVRMNGYLVVGSFALTLLLGATGFLISPQGLGAFASSLPAFLMSWLAPASVSIGQVLAVFAGYQLLPLVFALINVLRSWRSGDKVGKTLSLWFVSTMFLLLLFPGRQVSDLIWVSIPLWGLAARELGNARYWNYRPFYQPLLLAAVLVVFIVSFWTNITSLTYVLPDDPQYNLRLMIIAGTLILGGLSISLVSLGWGKRAGAAGTIWGFMIILGFGLLAGNWGTSHRGAVELREPWRPVPGAGENVLLDSTLESLGRWFNGSSEGIIIHHDVDSPAMSWALRDYGNAREGFISSNDELPDVVITRADAQEVRLSSSYRGQGLTWRVYPAWNELGRTEWMRWVLFREAPAINEEVIVWVRADHFLAFGEDEFTELYPLDVIEEAPDENFVPLEDIEEIFPIE